MAVDSKTITTDKVVNALNQEMTENFTQEYDRFEEILGLFPVETAQAGVALYQYKVTGSLNTDEVAEGDETPLSEYKVEKVPVGELTPHPYVKRTTAQAILKGGFENAILRTDKKMAAQMRAKVLSDFFTALNAGTGTASGTTLQAALANVDAALGNALETNADEGGEVVHFVNRSDAAAYLGTQNITTQTAFGLDYLETFLGIKNVILTNKVASGKVIATPVENIHVRGIDFSSLDEAGLTYESDALGIIGVQHVPAYNRTSAETYAILGMNALPEILDYIVIGSIGSTSAEG